MPVQPVTRFGASHPRFGPPSKAVLNGSSDHARRDVADSGQHVVPGYALGVHVVFARDGLGWCAERVMDLVPDDRISLTIATSQSVVRRLVRTEISGSLMLPRYLRATSLFDRTLSLYPRARKKRRSAF
jgi:hypothetical protein